MSPELIIFDCDGVLVDTEHITGAFFQRYLLGHGIQDPNGEALYRYRGFSLAGAIEDVESRIGKKVHSTFIEDFRRETMASMATDLQAIEGVQSALETIGTAKCVASNGPLNKMQLTLGVTGLRRFFGDALFSAYEIQSWKPDPGLFLHAAQTMKVSPARCLVVEDSVHGALAARAAGMPVFGFTPSHEAKLFEEVGAQCFDKMSDLPALIASI